MFHHFVSNQHFSIEPNLSNPSSFKQYFTPNFNQQDVIEKKKFSNKKSQIFSIDKENQEPNPDQYEKLLRLYEGQNTNLATQNKNLTKMVRDLKKKENELLEEANYLQGYLQKLKEGYAQDENEEQSEAERLSVMLETTTTKKTIVQGEQESKKEIKIQQLNKEFCQLIEDSLKEKDLQKRKQIRRQLADLANQMKKLRENTSTHHNLSYYFNSKNFEEQDI